MSKVQKTVGHKNRDRKEALKRKAIHNIELARKLRSYGSGALSDEELLALLLYRSGFGGESPEKARLLLGRFGSFAKTICADSLSIDAVTGKAGDLSTDFDIYRALSVRMLQSSLENRPILNDIVAVFDYCRVRIGSDPVEKLMVLFLNKQNTLIADEILQKGTVDHAPVYPREIVKRAIELSASSIILVHNHPSGSVVPSESDIEMTVKIAAISELLNISLLDHVIVSDSDHFSFKSKNLI